jgi:NTE family protein
LTTENNMTNSIGLDATRHLGNSMMNASRQVWLAGLGAAVVTRDWAEREAGNVFRTLVKQGTAVESRAIRLLGHRIESTVGQAGALWERARDNVRTVVAGYADTARTLVTRNAPASKRATASAQAAGPPSAPRLADRIARSTAVAAAACQARHRGAARPVEMSRRNIATSGRRRTGSRVGLALAGGGPLGGIYEVGALLALADSIEGLRLDALPVYVGVSSGSFVAAGLANGISPAQMYRIFIDDGDDAFLKPDLFLRPAVREYRRRLARLPSLGVHAALDWLRSPLRGGVLQSLAILARAMPTGIFDNGAIDTFLTRLFSTQRRSNDFRRLPNRLFVVATQLDTGVPVAFGAPGRDHIPISLAVEASSALPGLFPPVEIEGNSYVDGALNKTLHASLALEAGVDLLLCVNPLVPFDASRSGARASSGVATLREGGLPVVLSQTFRAIIHSRMRVGMEKYARQFPHADILLFEPDRHNPDIFFANLFSYAHRANMCAIAFHATRARLRSGAPRIAALLARHGLSLRVDRLQDRSRHVADALVDARPVRAHLGSTVRQAARDLERALEHLERGLAAMR